MIAALLVALSLSQAPKLHQVHLEELGLTQAWRGATGPRLEFPLSSRGDAQLTAATLWLRLQPEPSVHGMQVWLNGEKVLSLRAEAWRNSPGERPIRLPAELLRSRNLLGLVVESDQLNGCGHLTPGAWKAVQSARVELESTPVALPNNLGLLPLPWVDRDADQRAEVSVVFGGEMGPEHIALAGVLAGTLAVNTGVPLSFKVSEGALPGGHAVVLVDGVESAHRLGLPVPQGPAAAMMSYPGHPDSQWKLLVVEGSNLEELRRAVHGVATRFHQLAGPRVGLGGAPGAVTAPRLAPRWIQGGRSVALKDIPEVGALSAERGEPVTVQFRLPPDLWAWPEASFPLELEYALSFPEGAAAPRLLVEFNEVMVGAVTPEAVTPGRAEGRQTLRLPTQSVRGYNVLRVFVEADPSTGLCAGGERGNVRLSVSPDSVLHLEQFKQFAVLPDVARFLHDGYPFTQVADLSETAVWLGDAPTEEEVGTLLSVLAHLASVTGVAGSGFTVYGAGVQPPLSLDKELLVVGVPERHQAMRQWAEHWPIQVSAQRGTLRPQRWADYGGWVTSGRWLDGDRRKARGVLASSPTMAAVMGIRSPLSARRSAVAITATSARALPSLVQLQGHSHSSRPSGDVLLLSEGSRWMFQLGPRYEVGSIDAWTRVRWFFATHWLLLLPTTLVGVALLAVRTRRRLQLRAAQRLARMEEPP